MTVIQSAAVKAGIMPDYARAGGVLHRYASYTPSTNVADGSTIQMVPIPKDARIIDMHFQVASATSYGTFDVGDGGDTNRFFAGVDTATAADHNFSLFVDGTSNGANYKYTTQDTIDIVVKDSLLAAKTRLDINVFYVMCGTIADET